MLGYDLNFAWRTHQGRVRAHNEDAVRVEPDLGLVVVADGIGGAQAGEVASRMAVDLIAERFQREPPSPRDESWAPLYAEAAVEEANRHIWERALAVPDCRGMGTTVVMGFAGQGWLAYAHVGDSRLYRLRAGVLQQITRDHSFIQDVVDQGFFRTLAEARSYGIGDNLLTRALGSAREIRASTGIERLQRDDIYLFCTDGLTNMIPDDWLRQILAAIVEDLESAADALVQLACDRGGFDNVTLALLRVGAEVAAADAATSRDA